MKQTIVHLIIITLISLCRSEEVHGLKHRSIPKYIKGEQKTHFWKNKNSTSDTWVDLEVSLNFNRTLVKVNDKQIYYHKRNRTGAYEQNTGIHLLVLHQTTFNVIFKKLFYTATPAADKHLLRRLVNIHNGRLVVVIGYANFTYWLREDAKNFFYDSGSILGPEVAGGEFWILIFRKRFSRWKDLELDVDHLEEKKVSGEEQMKELQNINKDRKPMKKIRNKNVYGIKGISHEEIRKRKIRRPQTKYSDRFFVKTKIIYEGVSTVKKYRISQAPPFQTKIRIDSEPEEECSWHNEGSLKDLAGFCQLYDGYLPFCRCQDRVPLLPKFGKALHPDYEIIPVVIVTAERFTQVLRQVRQIREGEGGSVVPILICVDGFNPEIKHLARLLNVSAIYHNNKMDKGTRYRVNEHVRWCIKKTFEHNKESNFSIILEDDLDLSPDFVRYFQQIAWVMEADPTIKIANAYNYNAYPHTATDPTKLYMVQSYPYYGWMVHRNVAMEMIRFWAPSSEVTDWDLYLHYRFLNGSNVIIPEVPRTKHIGGGGVHVSGFIQETTYNVRPINKVPHVNLQLSRMLYKMYLVDLMKFIMTATVLHIKESPCSNPPLSSGKPGGKFVLYLNMTGEDDVYSSFAVIAECLGFDEDNLLEVMEGTFLRKYFFSELLMVACPGSPYCDIPSDSPYIYSPSKLHLNNTEAYPFIHVQSQCLNLGRRAPTSYREEVEMRNVYIYDVILED